VPSLTPAPIKRGDDRRTTARPAEPTPRGGSGFERNLSRLKSLHHSQCLFNRRNQSIVRGLRFSFDDAGTLHGKFTCNRLHQGYDGMVHGGVIAAIIDSSMAQCLMGHGVAGYTADLSIKYRKPMLLHKPALLETRIMTVKVGRLFTMRCEIVQENRVTVEAEGRFFKVK
jgi:acyl-coenzyme A thioesterase PaaI-like protein